MIGIGVDIVDIERISRLTKLYGDRFVGRVFTDAEAAYCLARPRPASCFAGKFAAKEAFLKALGVGKALGVRWRDVEVINDPRGKPEIILHGRAAELAEGAGVRGIAVSISDTDALAVAAVALEG